MRRNPQIVSAIMPRSKWWPKPWEALCLGGLLTCIALIGVAVLRCRPGADTTVSHAQVVCKDLSDSVEAYIAHPSNRDHRLPSRLDDLFHPPWGGPSLYRGLAEEPRDAWGNPFQMERRQLSDGSEYILIWTVTPDGTTISQFGIGPNAQRKF